MDLFSPELSVESLLHYDLKLHTNAWTLLSLFLHPSPNQNISLRGFEFSFPENEFYLPEEQFFCHIFFIMDSIFFSISFSMCSPETLILLSAILVNPRKITMTMKKPCILLPRLLVLSSVE